MAQRNPDHDAWANAIVRHPRFANIVEKTRDGSNATQDGSNATSNASSERRRQAFDTTAAELASVWRGKTVRGSSTSSRSTSSQSSKGHPALIAWRQSEKTFVLRHIRKRHRSSTKSH